MTAGQTNASMVWGTTFGGNKQSHILRCKYDIMFRSASFWSRVSTSRNIAVTFSTIFTKSGDTTFPVSDVLLISQTVSLKIYEKIWSVDIDS